MYENMDVFLMIDKRALPHFVEDALSNRAIPFVVIRNKNVIYRLVKKMQKRNEPVYAPAEMVLTLNFPEDEYIN